jgi:hypothetical protein
MLSIGLWRWYINITITILGIIHLPVSYIKQNISETSCLRLQVEPIQLGPIAVWRHRLSVCIGPEMSRFHLKLEIESSLGNTVFKYKAG